MKKIILSSIICLISYVSMSQKQAIRHSDYDSWKNLVNQQVSNNGKWISYEIKPQKGDSYLYVYNTKTGNTDSISRAYSAIFSANSDFLYFKIKPQADSIRAAKVRKAKKNNMPMDSLAVCRLTDGTKTFFANLKSIKAPKDKGSWISFLLKSQKKDSVKNKNKTLNTGKLVILNVETQDKYTFDNVSEYSISKNAKSVIFISQTCDSILKSTISTFDTKTLNINNIDSITGEAKKPCLSPNGNKAAYIISADTTKNKTYKLQYFSKFKCKPILDINNKALIKNWTISEYGDLFFSKNSNKLYFGSKHKPINYKKDSLLDEEKYNLDIWSWKDPLLQSQQKVELKKELEKTYLCVYDTNEDKVIQLQNENINSIKIYDKGNAKFSLSYSSYKYQPLESWDSWYKDYYIVNNNTGKQKLVLEAQNSSVNISPAQKYVYWYETRDSMWYCYNINTQLKTNISKSIKEEIYNQDHDMPSAPKPYGIAGWTKDDKYILIYDKYDIWKVNPNSPEDPINISNGYGRKNNIALRYINLDTENLFINLKKNILLKAFNKETKEAGFYSLESNNTHKIILNDYSYNTPIKAKNADILIWKKSSFKEYPDLHISKLDFSKSKKISNTNPQQKDKLWGSVDLVSWTSGDGDKLQGLLYKPENFDPNKKYPMLVYFYERTSDRLNKHYVPQPNWSIINPTYCTSNGYIVFMPDIKYPKVGYPGESAYSAIVSGTLAMADRYKFIDKDNMALQGQSWGGYQIAYLVTRTNLYKCAMAGAPVSNMTSAYGGIRWRTGRSRMFQYEHTQSRIGGTLWNSTLQYIENSPIFYAPKIQTPLLIMHNDNDGAVPWYQGIELFVAMRRLQKPCWMLTYNNENHNLRRRPNRVDLSIRTMQFFDHYLKGKPAPAWMKYGRPAKNKGHEDAYELK